MKKKVAWAWLCVLPCCFPAFAGEEQLEQRAAESRAVIKEFASQLKKTLKTSLKEDGPAKAISICRTVAPAIARQQSQKRGWKIGRTSLKFRNPANAPDPWERKVLEDFEARKEAGEDPAKMEYFEVVEQDGKKVFRYMKAIPTAEKPCLICHGEKIKPEVAEALDTFYPDDRARGFKPGDIRGAFTIVQPMP